MIKSEIYGGGHRWYCTECDQYHNGHLNVVSWTNSTPPDYCTRCETPIEKQRKAVSYAVKVMWRLNEIHGAKFVLPGSVSKIACLIKDQALQNQYNAHLLAAIINQRVKER